MDEAYSKAVDGLYAAATGDGSWENALDHVLAATGFDGAAMYVYDRRLATIDGSTQKLVRGLWHRLDTSGQADYENHYFRIDPRVKHFMETPNARVLYDYLHTPEDEIDRSEYYAWYQRQQGTRYYLGGTTPTGLSHLCAITLHRRPALGHADADEIARFQRLMDHIDRAVAVDHRLGLAGAGQMADDLIERNPTGIALLDAHGEVLLLNAAARRIVANADAVVLDGRTLRALRAGDRDRLSSVIANALHNGPADGLLRLARRTARRDYVVIATPMPARAGLFAASSPAVCLLISDPDEARQVPGATLQRLYGLTAAETRLALRLAIGETLDEAAQSLGIAVTTVRFHLAALFRKTESRRQSDLVRLLLSLPNV
jgi:DNA-binding CsgD family transcriptional regulator